MARDDAQKPQAAKAKSGKSAPAAKAAQSAAAKTGRRAPEVRPAAAGDTPPSLQRKDIENFVARKSAVAAQQKRKRQERRCKRQCVHLHQNKSRPNRVKNAFGADSIRTSCYV